MRSRSKSIGEDADLEKSGRILNRVIEWCNDGIKIEADQRHVREILKGLELERANHTATPCAVESKNEVNARNDGGKGENRRGRIQAQTKHEWDDMSEGDDRYRQQMEDDNDNDSQALAGTTLYTRCSTCHKTDQISSSLQCSYAVRWRSHQCGTWRASRGSEDTSR